MSTTGLIALDEATTRAMGTALRVVVPRGTPQAATARVHDLFRTWEAALSRFRHDSELSRLNARAGSPVTASPLLFGVVQAALRAARATDGRYDPALGMQVAALGYDGPFDETRRAAPVTGTVAGVAPGGAWRAIALDPVHRTITLPAGCALDLGGIAKGMAVDAAIGTLRNAGITTAMVSAGGDLRVVGRPPAHPHWGIAVEEVPGHVVALHKGALATSTTSRRRWGGPDETLHHLIDPATGRPAASGVRAVTVAARTCAQAEVAAKAALVAGPREGADMLARLGLDALVVPAHGRPIPVGGWPEERRWT